MANRYREARKSVTAKKIGRPEKYYTSIGHELVEYMQAGKKFFCETTRRSDLKFPTFEEFATDHDLTSETLQAWKKSKPEFSACYKKALEIQKSILLTGALNGKYDKLFSIFLAKNVYGMQDRVDMRQSGKLEISRVELPEKKKAMTDCTFDKEETDK